MKKDVTRLLSLLAAFLVASSLARAQCSTGGATESIIPQIVNGGAWVTTIVLTNIGSGPGGAGLSLFQETGGGATEPWSLDFVEMTSAQAQALTLPAGSTVFLHTLGSAPATTVGYAQFGAANCRGGVVVGYAIFTQRIPDRLDQDGTCPAAGAGFVSRILVPFDNTNGAITGIAIVNPYTSPGESISVGIRTSAGAVVQLPSITLPFLGHTSFAFPTQFPATAGQRGLAEFYSASGSISILALRFNSSAFTTVPVYSVFGPPIIIGSAP